MTVVVLTQICELKFTNDTQQFYCILENMIKKKTIGLPAACHFKHYVIITWVNFNINLYLRHQGTFYLKDPHDKSVQHISIICVNLGSSPSSCHAARLLYDVLQVIPFFHSKIGARVWMICVICC